MKELKTLKELENDMIGDIAMVRSLDLRKEAIRWVKELTLGYDEKGYLIKPDIELLHTIGIDEDVIVSVPSVLNFIKHFFNLTEKDLM